jgi:hypothetical protein
LFYGIIHIDGMPHTYIPLYFIVAIGMHPLNAKVVDANRIWRVSPQDSSVMQTTSTGLPLPERAEGRTVFTFDKTFDEDASNIHVHNQCGKRDFRKCSHWSEWNDYDCVQTNLEWQDF